MEERGDRRLVQAGVAPPRGHGDAQHGRAEGREAPMALA